MLKSSSKQFLFSAFIFSLLSSSSHVLAMKARGGQKEEKPAVTKKSSVVKRTDETVTVQSDRLPKVLNFLMHAGHWEKGQEKIPGTSRQMEEEINFLSTTFRIDFSKDDLFESVLPAGYDKLEDIIKCG